MPTHRSGLQWVRLIDFYIFFYDFTKGQTCSYIRHAVDWRLVLAPFCVQWSPSNAHRKWSCPLRSSMQRPKVCQDNLFNDFLPLGRITNSYVKFPAYNYLQTLRLGFTICFKVRRPILSKSWGAYRVKGFDSARNLFPMSPFQARQLERSKAMPN